MSVLQALQSRAAPFVALRHDLHRHPELGLQEFRTSELLAKQLQSWGYSVTRGLATTGLVAQLRRGNGSKRLGLRADMDALPIQEVNAFEHCSVHAGVMHACGHDGHSAMLMAAAQYIAQEVEFSGTLKLWKWLEDSKGGHGTDHKLSHRQQDRWINTKIVVCHNRWGRGLCCRVG
jgi:hippurate hydrolase